MPAGKALITEGETGHEFFVILERDRPGRAPRAQDRVHRPRRRVRRAGAAREGAPQRHRRGRDRHGPRGARPTRVRRHRRRGPRASRARCWRAWRSGSAKPTHARFSSPRTRSVDTAACRFLGVRRPRPHQIVFGIGVASAVFTVASGIVPGDHALALRLADRARGVRRRPDRAEGRVLRVGRRRCSSSSRGSRRCGSATTSGALPTTAARRRRTPSAGSTTSAPACGCRRCSATRRAGIMHSCIYFGFIGLFMATVLLEIDHQLPGSLKFLHGSRVPGVRVRRRPRGRRVPDRHRLGDRAPLRAAARTASASRPSPKTR